MSTVSSSHSSPYFQSYQYSLLDLFPSCVSSVIYQITLPEGTTTTKMEEFKRTKKICSHLHKKHVVQR